MAARPEVERIVWYGSFVTGTPTPRSDADLCVVIRGEVAPALAARPRHARSADYIPAVATPVPFDIAVLTTDEWEALPTWAPGWARAIGEGEELFSRADNQAPRAPM